MIVWALCCAIVGQPAESAPELDPVQKILLNRCLGCHAGSQAEGGLRLTSLEAMTTGGDSGSALMPGRPDDSALFTRVREDEMPPEHPLPEAEKAVLKAWIAGGAKWTGGEIDPLAYTTTTRAGYDWWSLRPIGASAAPDVPNADDPIDAWIRQRLLREGLEPNGPAERRELIRRVTYNLIGLPPTPEEIDEFAKDARPDAYERVVDRLLAHPGYGERWGRHWLDVVRFGESNGFERDLPRPNAWPYRDWVIRSLNDDLPYDEFVRRQIAADSLTSEQAGSLPALGFLVAGPHDTVVPVAERMRQTMQQDELEDLIGTIGQTFLGLTLNCARCHDHKFDPVSQTEYYQMVSVLTGVRHAERQYYPTAIASRIKVLEERRQLLLTELRRQEQQAYPEGQKPANADNASLPLPIVAINLKEAAGGLAALDGLIVPQGKVTMSPEGAVLDGETGHLVTPPQTEPLIEKTLEARVRLANRDQRGGGVLSVQTLDGVTFDAIVFGEQQPGRWMAGSNNFARTQSWNGPEETANETTDVHLAIVYRADGTIIGYRNGNPYGKPYQSSGPARFDAGGWQVLLGLRHSPAGGNRLLNGTVVSARIFDRALTPEEVEIAFRTPVGRTEADVLARLDDAGRQLREAWKQERANIEREWNQLKTEGLVKIYSAEFAAPGVTHVLQRGNVGDLGDVVLPRGLAAVNSQASNWPLSESAPEADRRRALADWLADPQNALAHRTIVNRVWHYHFGAGLVPTPNDLGFNGGEPSHPELLEWLSAEFLRGDRSLKRLHRRLVTSAAYQRSSEVSENARKLDAGNRLLWRMSPRRLSAEEVRDTMLFVAGRLNDSLHGPSYQDFNSYFKLGTQFYEPQYEETADVSRRTVYRMWARGGRNPFLDTFDCPDPSTTTPVRSTTTTPLQALSLLNNQFSLRSAEHLAERVRAESPENDVAGQVERLWLLAYGRSAAGDESKQAADFIRQAELAELCRAIFNSSEFVYVD